MGMHFSLFRKIVSEAHTSPLKMAQNAKIGILVPHAVSISRLMVGPNLVMFAVLWTPGTYPAVWGPHEPSENGPERQNWVFDASCRLNFPVDGWSKFRYFCCFVNPRYISGGVFFTFLKNSLRSTRALWKWSRMPVWSWASAMSTVLLLL